MSYSSAMSYKKVLPTDIQIQNFNISFTLKVLKTKEQKLKFIEKNIIDEIWDDRPGITPEREIIVLGNKKNFACGETSFSQSNCFR